MWSCMKVGERLAGEFFDEIALDVHGERVGPASAGLIVERNFGELVDHLLEVRRLHRLQVFVHRVDDGVAAAIGEAGGVGHQLAHGGRVIGIDEDHLAVGVDAIVDLEVREFGDVLGDGIGGEPLALFVEDHHGDAGDGLGHRVVAEDGVVGHGLRGGQIAHAVGTVVNNFAMAREQGDGARELLVVDLALDEGMEVFETLGGEADGFGCGSRQVRERLDGGLGKAERGCGQSEGDSDGESRDVQGSPPRYRGRTMFDLLERVIGALRMPGTLYQIGGKYYSLSRFPARAKPRRGTRLRDSITNLKWTKRATGEENLGYVAC